MEIAVAESLAQYLEQIEALWVRWSERKSRTLSNIWFRGHPSSAWDLVPSAMRPDFQLFSEHRLRHDFFLKSQPFLTELAKRPSNDWEWYFLMQHYGVPTRLLDWTESGVVALYFALIEDRAATRRPSDACVWVLEPTVLNATVAGIGPYVPIYTDKSIARYLPAIWDEESKEIPSVPAAFDPPYNSPRIAAQKGKFTVHGTARESLEKFGDFGDNLVSIRIPRKAVPVMQRQLHLTGVSEATLFPGLAGTARQLANAYSKTWQI